MKDKKAYYSFFITLLLVSLVYISITADSNTRSMGFGGKMPDYSSFAQEMIHSNDVTLYLYRSSGQIYGRLKRIAAPETAIILELIEDAGENFMSIAHL